MGSLELASKDGRPRTEMIVSCSTQWISKRGKYQLRHTLILKKQSKAKKWLELRQELQVLSDTEEIIIFAQMLHSISFLKLVRNN